MRTCHSDDLFRRIKDALTMAEVLDKYGISATRGGWASCPFHSERTPSLKVYDKSFFCFGCQTGGDLINFVARLYELTNKQAADKLCADFGLPGSSPPSAGTIAKWRREAAKRAAEQRKLEAYREEHARMTAEHRELSEIKPPEGGDYLDQAHAEYAQAMARLQEVATWLDEHRWR